MAKRIAKKKKSTNIHGWPHQCIKKCGRHSVYMKRNQKTEKMEHWCATCFQKNVIDTNPKAYEDVKPTQKKRRRVTVKRCPSLPQH